jgi:hypothetical protein
LEVDDFDHKFAIILGVAGVLASNPAFPFLPPVCDHLFAAFFVALFRVFLLIQLEFIRSRNPIPKTRLLILLSTLFLCYVSVDSAAALARSEHLLKAYIPMVFDIERYRMYFDCAYTGITLVYLIVALATFDLADLRRLIFVGFLVLGTDAVTIATHVWCMLSDIAMNTMQPNLIFRSVHAALAGTVLFLLHSDSGIVYESLKAPGRDDGGLHPETVSSREGHEDEVRL